MLINASYLVWYFCLFTYWVEPVECLQHSKPFPTCSVWLFFPLQFFRCAPDISATEATNPSNFPTVLECDHYHDEIYIVHHRDHPTFRMFEHLEGPTKIQDCLVMLFYILPSNRKKIDISFIDQQTEVC